MAWYLRKSFKVGPMRLNLSKSGVGASFGVKGARIGTGPKGTYVHGGRQGLYFRQSLEGKKVKGPHQTSNALQPSTAISSSALYSNVQISRKDYQLSMRLKDINAKPYIILGLMLFLVGIVGISMDSLMGSGIITLSVLLTGFFVSKKIANWFNQRTAIRLYERLKPAIKKDHMDNADYDIASVKAVLKDTRVKGIARTLGISMFFRDSILAAADDVRITQIESDRIESLQKCLEYSGEAAKTIKMWAFNKAYLKVIEDEKLTAEEENDIDMAKNALKLNDDDIKEEISTLETLRSIRLINEEGLKPIEVNIELQQNEECYHKSPARLVKEKVVKSYQVNGVKEKVTDWVSDREGDMYLTSKRVIISGDGVTSIKLDKIFNLETDVDGNKIALDVDGRKKPVFIACPDSLVASAKLNKLLSRETVNHEH